jgi:hypothetical protein
LNHHTRHMYTRHPPTHQHPRRRARSHMATVDWNSAHAAAATLNVEADVSKTGSTPPAAAATATTCDSPHARTSRHLFATENEGARGNYSSNRLPALAISSPSWSSANAPFSSAWTGGVPSPAAAAVPFSVIASIWGHSSPPASSSPTSKSVAIDAASSAPPSPPSPLALLNARQTLQVDHLVAAVSTQLRAESKPFVPFAAVAASSSSSSAPNQIRLQQQDRQSKSPTATDSTPRTKPTSKAGTASAKRQMTSVITNVRMLPTVSIPMLSLKPVAIVKAPAVAVSG